MTRRGHGTTLLRTATLPVLLAAGGCWSTAVDVLERLDAAGEADGADDDGGATSCRAGSADCPAGSTCDLHACDAAATGRCVAPPPTCPVDWSPVCGCDDVTYWNDCERLLRGAARSRGGECDRACRRGPDGGCDGDDLCAVGGCLAATGRCVARPSTCGTAGDPACGCDGRTYAGRCEMFEAHVALDHPGECAAPPCVPACETVGAGTAWVDSCTRETICGADCAGCSATCEFSGLPLEGWYAWCTDPNPLHDGGCGDVWGVIHLGTCGP